MQKAPQNPPKTDDSQPSLAHEPGRVLSQAELRLLHTGIAQDPIRFCRRHRRKEALLQQTETIAAKLESAGIPCRRESRIAMIEEATGFIEEMIEWRSIRLLPIVAQRERAAMTNYVNAFMQTLGKRAENVRITVVTSGKRIPVGGDLRGRMAESTLKISKFGRRIWKKYRIELLLRATEYTVDDGLDDDGRPSHKPTWSVHLHHNLMYLPHKHLGDQRWNEFVCEMHDQLGTILRECGKVKNSNKFIRYAFKPAAIKEAPVETLVWLFKETFNSRQITPFGSLKEFKTRATKNKIKFSPVNDGHESGLRPVRKASRGPRPQATTSLPADAENVSLGRTAPQARSSPWMSSQSIVMGYTGSPQTIKGKKGLAILQERQAETRRIWDHNGAPDPEIALAFGKALLMAETDAEALKISLYAKPFDDKHVPVSRPSDPVEAPSKPEDHGE